MGWAGYSRLSPLSACIGPSEFIEPFWNSEVEAMKFRPLHDRVVVRRIEEDTKTAGGIIIPDTAKEKPMQGEIIAVGPGARDESGKLVPRPDPAPALFDLSAAWGQTPWRRRQSQALT